METEEIIEYLIASLQKYPIIRFDRVSNGKLVIFGQGATGFDITLEEDVREITLYLENFHWHFERTEEDIDALLNIVYLSLTGNARVKEISSKGKPYKWTLQLKDDAGNWFDDEVTANLNLTVRDDSEVRYFQNEIS